MINPEGESSSRPSDADAAYLRPLVERLGAQEVHRLVDLIDHGDDDGEEEPATEP